MNLLINADARQIPLADCSVNCIVTSPPYYGLRDYGTARWEGGDPDCDHKINDRFSNKSGLRDSKNPKTIQENDWKGSYYKDICAKCGAVRIDDQIGLEQTPQEYVDNLVQVFRECWRILKDNGTAWVVLGDSYAGSGKGRNADGTAGRCGIINKGNMGTQVGILHKVNDIDDLKPKDLIGIPWMVAFALRADGWYLRQAIIWAKACSGNIRKGSAMPESVRDRFQKSHEYIFLLSKSPRYYFDNEAVKEKCVTSKDEQIAKRDKLKPKGQRDPGGMRQTTAGFDKINKVYEFGNRRSVWLVSPIPYKGDHFAIYPPKLIEPCILAGCPKGGIVFDPFVGSGTTVAVANSLGRMGIGIDLNYNYLLLAQERVRKVQLPLLLV